MAGDVLEFAGDKNLALVVGNFVDHDVVIVLLVQAEDKLLHRRVHVQQQPLVNLALALYMHTRTYLHVYTLAPRDTCIHIHTHAPTPRDSHATTHTQPQQLSAGGGRRRQEAAGGGRRRQEAAGGGRNPAPLNHTMRDEFVQPIFSVQRHGAPKD